VVTTNLLQFSSGLDHKFALLTVGAYSDPTITLIDRDIVP